MSAVQVRTSPWQPRAAAAALLAWPAGGPARIAHLLQGAWQAWARDWGLDAAAGEAPLACSEAAAAYVPGDAWAALGRGTRGTAWTCAAPDEEALLAQALFAAPDAATPIVREVVAACRADVQARLACALQLAGTGGDGAPPPAAWQPWSGALLAVLPGGRRVLLEAALVRALLPPGRSEGRSQAARAPLVGVQRAAAALTLPLQVRLAPCEVDLGSLQDLRPGDVLRLPHRLDAPAAVTGPDGQALFGGWLVRRHERKAVELAPAGAPGAMP